MQTEVLRYIHKEGDYEVVVRTQDISYSWQRFKGRIDYTRRTNPEVSAPREYCEYICQDECKLQLEKPFMDELSEHEIAELKKIGNKWVNLWPVVYETCKYQINVLFYDVDDVPQICHVRKDIEDSFFYQGKTYNKDGLSVKAYSGNIDYLNEPGRFRLEFSYQKGGKSRHTFVSFDVVSPKLDTKSDYKSLLKEVNDEYTDVIYRYLSITLQQFCRGHVNNDATWMSAFQTMVEDYVKNVNRVIQNPHSQIVNHRTSRKAEQIKHWTPAMEERYGEVEKEGKLEEFYFNNDESSSTHDTMENRFVKHTLHSIGQKLNVVIGTILAATQEELSEKHRKVWIGYSNTIKKLSNHPFFKTVGKFDGLTSESLVLQSRTGYQQIYKDWLKLKRGIDLYNGAANIGTLQIWEIYELWCFIKMKKMVAEVIGIKRDMPNFEKLVTEPKGTLLNPFTDSTLEHVVEYHYPVATDDDSEERKTMLRAHEGDIITLHYQHTFNRRSGNDEYGMGINTATTEQRPDIVLNISKASGEVVLTYLYDAKYQVINDKNLDKDFEAEDIAELERLKGGDYPPANAINQMHRYRDAIYYSKKHEKYRSKEIIGGYILFPGRGEDENIQKRYYSASVESVNIGAFPLLPSLDKSKEGSILRSHLNSILMKKLSTESHVAKAKPQRTLAYVTEEEKERMLPDDLVMVALAGSAEKRQWTFDGQWYNIPLDKIADTPWMKAKYLLLHIKGEQWVGNIRKIVKSNHDVWTAEKLVNEGYPSKANNSAYFMIRIHKESEAGLAGTMFDVKNIPLESIYWGSSKMPFMLVKLNDIKKMLEK
ncbi:MAG: DUF2357 domain-containing protein [Prevotellaceae bacterium]|nr:DUF2357 domain-containing protein [Candidatus Faecinaster equi]